MLQMLALIAMENPKSQASQSIRNSREKVLNSLVIMDKPEDISKNVIRGQYRGYKDEKNVKKDSTTATYFRIRAFLSASKWKDVPFYLESGKALDKKNTEIIICFHDVKDCVCPEHRRTQKHQNILSIKIYPRERIFIRFWAKKPGLVTDVEPRDLEFNYLKPEDEGTGEYDKVLLDCMKGDQTLFASTREVKLAWKYITPIIQNWEHTKLYQYKKRSTGPEIVI